MFYKLLEKLVIFFKIFEYHKQIYSYRCKKKETNECLITDDDY